MIPLAKKATPAAIAVLRQATAIWPKRMKASDGLLPSKAHVHQNVPPGLAPAKPTSTVLLIPVAKL